MTPDVSSVMNAAEAWARFVDDIEEWIAESEVEWVGCRERTIQAAEQACYRYALAMLERLLNRKTPEAVGGWAVKERILRDEMEAVQQLIAGSA